MTSQKTYSKPLPIYFDDQTKILLKAEAKRRGLTVSAYIKCVVFPTIEKLQKSEVVSD